MLTLDVKRRKLGEMIADGQIILASGSPRIRNESEGRIRTLDGCWTPDHRFI